MHPKFFFPRVVMAAEDGGAASGGAAEAGAGAADATQTEGQGEAGESGDADGDAEGAEGGANGSGGEAGSDGAANDDEGSDGKGDEGDKSEGMKPEDYEEFTLPEGFERNEELETAFRQDAAEAGWDQATAQKAVDLYMKREQAKVAEFQALQKDWADQCRNDPEFGGQKFDESMALAKQTMETFGSEGLKAALEASGLGNNPDMLRFFVNVGKQISEDNGQFARGSGDGGSQEMSGEAYMAEVLQGKS